jgi:hypothetical protein
MAHVEISDRRSASRINAVGNEYKKFKRMSSSVDVFGSERIDVCFSFGNADGANASSDPASMGVFGSGGGACSAYEPCESSVPDQPLFVAPLANDAPIQPACRRGVRNRRRSGMKVSKFQRNLTYQKSRWT